MNTEILLSRISALCEDRGISMNTAFVESGVGKNFKSNLKTANPTMGKITMLAVYFGVSVDYLLGKSEDKEPPAYADGELEENMIVFHRDGKTQKKKFTKEQMAMFMAMVDAIPDTSSDDI